MSNRADSESTEIPSVTRPTPMRRLRNEVLIALAAAFAVEMTARIIQAETSVPRVYTEALSLLALMLICGSALYLILWLRDTPLLKWAISLAAGFLLLSQFINMMADAPAAANLLRLGAWHSQVEAALLLGGLVLMIATLYLALFEMVGVKQALIQERVDLYSEIRERQQAQAALNESRDQLRRLSAHMESLRENERTAVAREIHDELGQTLTSLKIELSSLKKHLGRETLTAGAAIEEILASMAEQINGTMQVVRRIITELRPGILDDLGIVAAVEWQARDFEKRTGVRCIAATDANDLALSRDKSTALFRIVQEALTNVARHANASEVNIELARGAGGLLLTVADNGRGMEPAAAAEARSFGLLGMRERAAQFAGDVQITSARGTGTVVKVVLPLDASEGIDAVSHG